MADPINHLSPDRRRRMNAMLMANQFDTNYPVRAPDDTFLNPHRLSQGPAPMPRNVVADELRERGYPTYAGRFNSMSYGPGLLTDAVAGIANAAVVEPVAAWNRMIDAASQGERISPEDSFNVAGAAMVGGLAAPRPANSLGALSPRILESMQRPSGESGFVVPTRMPERTTYRGYHGSRDGDALRGDEVPWGSSRPDVAADYALDHPIGAPSTTPDGAMTIPVEYRFANPMVVDAQGKHFSDLRHPNNPRRRVDTDDLANIAQDAGHDGLVVNNVLDMLSHEGGPPATTYAPLRTGTVYSPLTGDLLYANGGKQGAAAGAAVNAMQETPGIRAFHGSPHDFDKFDLSKIGTGEGAQAFGHGLYFAENEGVARSYRDGLAAGKPTIPEMSRAARNELNNILGDYRDNVFADGSLQDTSELRSVLRERYKPYPETDAQFARNNVLTELLDYIDNGSLKLEPDPGRMYEVNIKADPNDFIDWDKPLSQQNERVRGLVGPEARRVYERRVRDGTTRAPDDPWHMRDALADPEIGLTDRLREAGIPGIRYLDQGSRDAGQGTSNYVVFDDSLIDILRKYGLAGLTAGGAAANLLGQYGQPTRPPHWSAMMRDGDL